MLRQIFVHQNQFSQYKEFALMRDVIVSSLAGYNLNYSILYSVTW